MKQIFCAIFLVIIFSISAFAESQMWVTADTLFRRTCPSTKCGAVGKHFFRERAEIFENKNGWGRVTKYFDASCSGNRSQYVDTGRADCSVDIGIANGKFAEWVKLGFLSKTLPAGPAANAKGTSKLYQRYWQYIHANHVTL